MEQRAAIKFCVKLKETVTETFGNLKIAYVEECLSSINVFEWHKMSKEAQKVRTQKFGGRNKFGCIFMLKVSFIANL
jgi:hypothetical protein